MPGILLWSIPGIVAGAAFVAGVSAFGAGVGFGARLAAVLTPEVLEDLLTALPGTGDAVVLGACVIPGMSRIVADVSFACSWSIMRWSMGSLCTRSRMTGSAIMRM